MHKYFKKKHTHTISLKNRGAIYVMWVPQGKEKKHGEEKCEEGTAKKLMKITQGIESQMQKFKRTQNRRN